MNLRDLIKKYISQKVQLSVHKGKIQFNIPPILGETAKNKIIEEIILNKAELIKILNSQLNQQTGENIKNLFKSDNHHWIFQVPAKIDSLKDDLLNNFEGNLWSETQINNFLHYGVNSIAYDPLLFCGRNEIEEMMKEEKVNL